jgi:DNA repair ATPase RecN
VAASYERKLWRLLLENLGARESLMEHQDALVRAEAERGAAVVQNELLEVAARTFDASLAERSATEAARAREFQDTVKAWSDHVEILGEHIRRAASDHRAPIEIFSDRDQSLADAEQRCRRLAESERSARTSEQAATEALKKAQPELDSIDASRSWKIANRLGRMRRLFDPRSRRIDAAQQSTPPGR